MAGNVQHLDQYGQPVDSGPLSSQSAQYYSDTQTTQLPEWYNAATQNIVNLGQAALNPAQQAAGQATQNINNLAGQTNTANSQAISGLQSIGANAANPWLQGGGFNQNTPLGQAFQGQQNGIDQAIQGARGQVDAGAIAGGNFGSLRGQTAANTAAGNVALQQSQNQIDSYLKGQGLGIQANQSVASTGNQALEGALNAGNFAVNSQYAPLTAYSNLLAQSKAPTTVYSTPSAFKQSLATQNQFGDNGLFFSDVQKPTFSVFGNTGFAEGGHVGNQYPTRRHNQLARQGLPHLADGGQMPPQQGALQQQQQQPNYLSMIFQDNLKGLE